MNPNRALVTGVTGQDGSYLCELLLSKGYEVHGLVRRSSNFNTERIQHLYQDPHESEVRLFTHYADLTDANGLSKLIRQVKPTEVYNLGAQSHVRVSFDQPIYTADATGIGALKLLEAVRDYQEQSGYQITCSDSHDAGEEGERLLLLLLFFLCLFIYFSCSESDGSV